MFAGMLDVKKTQQQLSALRREAGFLRPMDALFAAYYEGYKKTAIDHRKRLHVVLAGHEDFTLYDSMMLKFRRKLKEALARLHGTVPLPEISQTDVGKLLRK